MAKFLFSVGGFLNNFKTLLKKTSEICFRLFQSLTISTSLIDLTIMVKEGKLLMASRKMSEIMKSGIFGSLDGAGHI